MDEIGFARNDRGADLGGDADDGRVDAVQVRSVRRQFGDRIETEVSSLLRNSPDLRPVNLRTDSREIRLRSGIRLTRRYSVYTVDGMMNSSSAFSWRNAAASGLPLS